MKTGDRVNELKDDLQVLYNQYDVRDKRINEYIESLGLEPGLKLLEYPKGPRYHISDFICKTDIIRISGDIYVKEKQLVNAVEAYLKLECYESYLKNNLEKAFEKAREDDDYRSGMLEIIERFIFE
ncbi:hypothetical protein B0H39_003390 [Clostridium beijerinckii]|uniref:hypothetical protein n=1 Tax=Clostridium beijerinckii TaxID=1520 RepID=UPI001A9BA704|nr:hypothetical protein [Clostridium beijerinckii]NOW85509.1 hypothetical protein [Clostridium beijerinckii]